MSLPDYFLVEQAILQEMPDTEAAAALAAYLGGMAEHTRTGTEEMAMNAAALVLSTLAERLSEARGLAGLPKVGPVIDPLGEHQQFVKKSPEGAIAAVQAVLEDIRATRSP